MLVRAFVLVTFLSGLLGVCSDAPAQQLLRKIKSNIRGVAKSAVVRKKVHTGKDSEMELLAKEIDWLEAHIDKFGSVVAKQPDIWGESRLTKFRSEYEDEMAARLGEFTVRDNASISRQDIAAFASATGVGIGPTGAVPPVSATITNTTANAQTDGSGTTGASLTITPPTAPLPISSFTAGSNLEVTEELNQRSRYINHLHQLRRINSGDDTSDAPGYSLNLVRIPISITPGRETNRGYGAKVTITAKPYTSNTLLPETFQNLVINDLVDQLALPVLKACERPNLGDELRLIDKTYAYLRADRVLRMMIQKQVIPQATSVKEIPTESDIEMAKKALENSKIELKQAAQQMSVVSSSMASMKNSQRPTEMVSRATEYQDFINKTLKDNQKDNQTLDSFNRSNLEEQLSKVFDAINNLSINSVSRRRRTTLPVPQILLTDVFKPEDIIVLAGEFVGSYSGRMVAWNQREDTPQVHLADVRHFLQSHFESTYRMLSTPANRQIVGNIIEGRLADTITSTNLSGIRAAYQDFSSQFHYQYSPQQDGFPGNSVLMRRFAWPIIVEMALLNEQLNKDVHDIAETRGDCGCHPSRRYKYYLTMPKDHEATQLDTEFLEAAEQFQRYVECRWPIHVFHVDPVNEDQNVQASSALSRQLAIAAAIGVSNGTLNFRQASQFTRSYREEINTIALNRTISGFSHNNDTFGWTFRPRVQIQPSRGNIAALGETLFGRSPDVNLRDAALEPGMRECTAVVLMPSFVPYCDFDVSTSWFRLDNPRSKEISNHQNLKLSRSIKFMQDCAVRCASHSHLYRDGEVKRLLNRVDQLERELPMQSMRAQVPYENTLGGFELFSNGVTDLSPELVGWYGAPGIAIGSAGDCCPGNCSSASPAAPSSSSNMAMASDVMAAAGSTTRSAAPAMMPQAMMAEDATPNGTTIFLVGDNFSVHETDIIAGGVSIPATNRRMISRQVIQITVPSCARTVELVDGGERSEYVAIYAATPYGVTSHLHVPVFNSDAASESVTNRLAAVESRLPTYQWENPTTLPIIAGLQETIAGGAVQRTQIQVVEAAKATSFRLTWTPTPETPSEDSVPRMAALMGQFQVNNRPVGNVFWINKISDGTGDEINLRKGSKTYTAETLLNKLRTEIENHLTIDVTGDASPVTVTLQTWVVPVINGVPRAPIATSQPIMIELTNRPRVNPATPNSTQQTDSPEPAQLNVPMSEQPSLTPPDSQRGGGSGVRNHSFPPGIKVSPQLGRRGAAH